MLEAALLAYCCAEFLVFNTMYDVVVHSECTRLVITGGDFAPGEPTM